MSAEICNLLVKLDEIRDDLACREHDLEVDSNDTEAFVAVDDLRCREADVTNELKGLDYTEEI